MKRKISGKFRDIYILAISGKNPLAAIRSFCLECCGYSTVDVGRCTDKTCPLYKYRSKFNQFGLYNKNHDIKQWSEDENKLFKKMYHNTSTKELAKRFGCSIRSIYNHKKHLGLKKRLKKEVQK